MAELFSGSALFFRRAKLEAGGVELASDIDLALSPGQIALLSGPNGVGKSTLLNQLAQSCSQSTLLLRPPFGLRDEYNVGQQVKVLLNHFPGGKLDVDQVLEVIGLGPWRNERVGTLSSGQRARLGMAILVVSRCSVWLLDEPLNALDYNSLQLLFKLVREHLATGGYLLVVSHLGQTVLREAFPDVGFSNYVWNQGKIRHQGGDNESNPEGDADACSGAPSDAQAGTVPATPTAVPSIGPYLRRELSLALASSGSFLWAALFLLMILCFFGLVLRAPDAQESLAVVWVCVLLSAVLSAKEWFLDDYKCGWCRIVQGFWPLGLGVYWVAKVLLTVLVLLVLTLPAGALACLVLGVPAQAMGPLLLALVLGVLASVPLLALVSLMVLMTRGGAVLVYILALPLLVPVLVFGLEASQAVLLGRSAGSALGVLAGFGGITLLLGPWVAQKLFNLILE